MRTILSCLLIAASSVAVAQSNYKEGSNAFAMYTQTGELKNLENAKKFIDASYKTRRDSSNTRINILRSMVYSAISYADSTRSIKNDKDPIDLTYEAFGRIKSRDLMSNPAEVKYIKQNLAAAHVYKAAKAMEKKDFEQAYNEFLKVKSLAVSNFDVQYNLAVLATETKQYEQAVQYYQELVKRENAPVEHYLELTDIYRKTGAKQEVLNTLQNARVKFPENKSVLMNLVQEFAQLGEYKAIVPIIGEAIKYEPENIELHYLAGYANENAGNIGTAKSYYEQALQLNGNNYESNLALGLIYLNDFLKDEDNVEAQYNAQNLLLKANEIRPYDVNALKSLALYYEKAGDPAQLDRVNLLLNQLSNN